MVPSDAIRDEKIRTLYAQSGPVLWSNLIVSTIVGVALWRSAPHGLVLAWNGAIAAMVLVRSELGRRQTRSLLAFEPQLPWGRRFTIGSACAGVLWGAGGALLYDSSNPFSQLLVVFAVGGMTAAAAGTLACYLPAFFAYCVCALLPLSLRIFLDVDLAHWSMGAMFLLYALFMQRVARTNHASIEQAFRLAFEKMELSRELSEAQTRLEEQNRTLEQRVLARTRELERQAEALRDAQRMEAVGRLAGGIAHDFNNLLTVVLTNVSMLREEPKLEAEERNVLEETRAAAQRGADLVRQLLAFSRRQQMERRVEDMNQLVANLTPLLRRLVGAHISMQVEAYPDPVWIRVDPSQFEQVLLNLTANARDAMPKGGTLRIRTQLIEARQNGELEAGWYGVLSVADSGVGMDADTLKHAFEPFFTTKGLGFGTGLGLATVYGIVQQSGGQVLVESSPGSGSVFSVYLPESLEAAVAAEERPRPRLATPRISTVLVAEDEPAVRSAIQRSLQSVGHRVLVAEDGARALLLARTFAEPIDLLITDVVMPNMSGVELGRKLREERAGLAVLYMSGYSFGESLPPSDLNQGSAYLHKPFDMKTLLAKVAELLSVTASRTPRAELAPSARS